MKASDNEQNLRIEENTHNRLSDSVMYELSCVTVVHSLEVLFITENKVSR